MKKPITLISNDWHLKRENIDLIKNLVTQKCGLAKKLGLTSVFCLGDIFDSRKSQPQDVLTAFTDILDIFQDNKIKLIAIPGNHDKSVYSSSSSYLDPYFYHPAFELYSEFDYIDIQEDLRIHVAPFFVEEVWQDKSVFDLLEGGKNVLFTHVGTTGSRNNDGSTVENCFNNKTFKGFDRVFSGHYHDTQEIYNGLFIHTPSLFQSNFGENDNKGFTILYDDLSYEIHVADFPRFIKVKIDLDKIENKELARLTKDYTNNDNNVRFEFIGSENKLKSLKKDMFVDAGIEVKTVIKEVVESVELAETNEVVSFDKTGIVEEFKLFCEDNSYSVEEGLIYLKTKLNG